MSATEDLIAKLRSTRLDYEEERVWHKELLDAAYGIGGYIGRNGPTAVSHLGWAASAYASYSATNPGTADTSKTCRATYLDQFPREDSEKFAARISVAHYTNYVGPIHEQLLSHVNKAEMQRDGTSPTLDEWMLDVDGKGTSWDTLMREVVRPRASLLGWCPVLFDMPIAPAGGETISQARANELALTPKAIPLYPINLLDWIADDDGDLEAAKIRTTHEVRFDLIGASVSEERYSLWYSDRVVKYVVTTDGNNKSTVSEPVEVAHSFGKVPVLVCRGKPTPDDRVRGMSIVGDLAPSARRLFNLESELDDHIRGQVFAILGVPVADTGANGGEIVIGASNAIKVPMESNLLLHYVAPPATVSATLETRILAMVREIYRIARIEYTKAAGITSGIARAYEFEQTNQRLGDMAGSFARFEEESLELVDGMLGGDADITVTAPTDFSVEDLESKIANTLAALALKLGVTADTELRRRLVRTLLPNLPSERQTAIEDELEAQATQGEQDEAMRLEAEQAAADAAAKGAIDPAAPGGKVETDPSQQEAA